MVQKERHQQVGLVVLIQYSVQSHLLVAVEVVEEIRTPMVNLEVLVEEVIMDHQAQQVVVIHHHFLQHKVQMEAQEQCHLAVVEAVQAVMVA